MSTERPEGAFLNRQNIEEIKVFTPSKKEKISRRSLRPFILSAFLGSILGLAAWQGVQHRQVDAQEPFGQVAVTRALDEPPCEDFGDVDEDRRVTAIDAMIILQNEARLLAYPLNLQILRRGDVTGNGVTNSVDALSILSFVSRESVSFPVCNNSEPTPTKTPTPTRTAVPIPPTFTPTQETPTPTQGEPKMHDFLELKMAVFYYGLEGNQVRKIQNSVERAGDFVWTNSCLNVRFKTEYFEITEVIGENSISDATLVHTLAKHGLTVEDFDVKYHIGNDVDGVGWSRLVYMPFNKGLSHQRYREITNYDFPEDDPNVNYDIVGIMEHENLHVFDGMADAVGYAQVWHADQPIVYADREGTRYHFEAGLLRDFFCNDSSQRIMAVSTRWGEIKYFEDANGNGLPDTNFGDLAPSDQELGPGWDFQRYTKSIYGNENEEDNLRSSSIVNFTPTIDGRIERGWGQIAEGLSWNGLQIGDANIYAAWTSGYLYIAGSADKAATLRIDVDADADGIWNGRYNLNIAFQYASNFLFYPFGTDRSDDARIFNCEQQIPPYSRTLEDGLCEEVSDNNRAYVERFGRIIRDEETIAQSRFDLRIQQYVFEIRIPVDYPLIEGNEVGMMINFEGKTISTVFAAHKVHYFTLVE